MMVRGLLLGLDRYAEVFRRDQTQSTSSEPPCLPIRQSIGEVLDAAGHPEHQPLGALRRQRFVEKETLLSGLEGGAHSTGSACFGWGSSRKSGLAVAR